MTRGERAWVKFFGNARNRVSPDTLVLDVLERTGAHWAGWYPAGRRPRSVREGATMFLARLVTAHGVGEGGLLGELMDALGAEAFASTQRNAMAGRGNVDPRQAYRQQPAVRLSHEGREWLDARLDEAFARFGRLGAADLARLNRLS